MSNLNSAVRKTEALLNKSRELNFEYQDYLEQLNNQVASEHKGRKEAHDLITQREKDILNELERDKIQIFRELDAAEKEEYKTIEEAEQPVTADMLAELQMLDETFVRDEDLTPYIEKYKNTPLAMRKLKAIASKHKNMADFPASKADQLKVFMANIQSFAESAAKPQFDRMKPVVDMVIDGQLRTLQTDSEIYSQL